MRKVYSILAGLLLTASVFAQAPQKMSYQAVIRNSSNALITSTPVGMQISVLQGSLTGTAVYVETQTPSTNANGLVSVEIGSGTVVSGNFSTINWVARQAINFPANNSLRFAILNTRKHTVENRATGNFCRAFFYKLIRNINTFSFGELS